MIFEVPFYAPQTLGDTNSDCNDLHLFAMLCLDTIKLWLEHLALLAPTRPEFDESRCSFDVVNQIDRVALQILQGCSRSHGPEGKRYRALSGNLRPNRSRHSKHRHDSQPQYADVCSHDFP
jgi:hypothetical protein